MIARRTSIAFVFACAAAVGAQQPARDGTPASATPATIRGRVVLNETGVPLARAFITTNGIEGVTSDDEGRYEITGLPAGRVTLRVSKLGYAPASHSFRLPAEQRREVELTAGQTVTGVDFVFTNGGVIVVRVLNPRGEPASGVRVAALRFKYVDNSRSLLSAAGATNDIGEARIFGLPAGDYYVVTMRGTSDPGYVYYPGTALMSDAQTVAVTAGQEIAAVVSQVVSAAVEVTGMVRGADGLPFPQLPLVVSAFPGGTSGHTHTTVRRFRDGGFSVSPLSPGRYLLQVNTSAELPGDEMQYVWHPFDVSGEPLTLVVNATRGGAIRGRIVSDTGEPLTGISPGSLKLALMAGTYPENEREPEVVVRNDWTFSADTVFNPRVLRLTNPVGGWHLKAVTLDERDITDTPIDFINGLTLRDVQVVLTRQTPVVTGSVEATPTLRHAVIVYSADMAQWTLNSRRVVMSRVDANGRFSIHALPAGRYLAVAVDDLDTGEERDPTLLQRLRTQAVTFTLVEGEPAALTLKLAR